MRTLMYAIVGLGTVLGQGVILPVLFSYQAMPDIFLAWIVVITLVKGRMAGCILACLSGILQDIVISNLFGFHLLPYVVVAYICSFWTQSMYEEQWYKTALWMVPCSIINSLLQGILIWLGQEPISIGWYMWYHLWPAILWNVVLGALLHKLSWQKEEREEYLW